MQKILAVLGPWLGITGLRGPRDSAKSTAARIESTSRTIQPTSSRCPLRRTWYLLSRKLNGAAWVVRGQPKPARGSTSGSRVPGSESMPSQLYSAA